MNDNLKAILQFFPKLFKSIFGSKNEKIRNKYLFKRGGYAVALIAVVLVAVVVLNVLVGVLAKRFTLEFDLTTDKKNSISEENREYIKGVDREVVLYVLASSPEEYYGGYMQYYAQQSGITASTTDYYRQTTKFLELYDNLNSKISVNYVDPYGTEMADLNTKYPESYGYGDIIVTSEFTNDEGKEFNNYRLIGFDDIYTYSDVSGYASSGMDYYYIDGSTLETSLTSAIAGVTSEETKTVGILASHSNSTAYSYYASMLKLNNFVVEEITDTVITAIPETYDAVVIVAPQSDFVGTEIDALNDYLYNGGRYGKSVIYYADSGYQKLPNLYSFLEEWGIGFKEGIVFETDKNNRLSSEYSTYISYSASSTSSIVPSGKYYVSGYNVPMFTVSNDYDGRTTESLLVTNETVVCAPLNTPVDWEPTSDYAKEKFATCIQTTESEYDENNNVVSSHVIAFSSTDFISEEYILQYSTYMDYKEMALRALRELTGMGEVTITFDEKTIDATSEVYITSDSAATAMLVIFVAIVPLALIVASFIVFARRRNK